MARAIRALVLLCLPASYVLFAAGPPAPNGTYQVELNGQTFTLPRGFVIERVAGPPLVERPITADFDEEGRLYVADSSGSNEKVDVQLKKKPHRIVRLQDADGDGKFEKGHAFADRMMFPEGTMWSKGSLYVAAPPSIWKLTDTDGDGLADRRGEWFEGKTLTGCANDLHGPYQGPDGWIYWCKGAFARQTYERPGKPPFVTTASHIFRSRPDGTGIEPVMTGGMDNPVDVVFTPTGERIFTTTFFQHPGGGRRDGLIHAVYGGLYGKDHQPIYDHPWTGPTLMPVLTHLGPAAPCGLTRMESAAFGPDYQDNVFACLFNLRKVTRHVLVRQGATFTTRDEDFLTSSSLDFHPTDVIEDADGSLLVVDTGGWYKLCCPTSQLVKPDVLGAIYRIRRLDAPRVDDPRGRRIAWDKKPATELTKLLDDPRPAVRRRAVETLGGLGAPAVPTLEAVVRTGKSAEARRNALWALTRIDKGRAAVRLALKDADETVRLVALHSISLWRDQEALPELIKGLSARSEAVRRACAEALGRLGDSAAVPALLASVAETEDRVLEHSLIYALIEIGARKATAAGLESKQARTRRAAMIALDQMADGKLDAAVVARDLESSNELLKETASWIVGRHPDWGPQLAGILRQRLRAPRLSPAEQETLTQHLARLARAPAVQELLAEPLRDKESSLAARQTALRAMARSSVKAPPATWVAGLGEVLSAGSAELLPDALAVARALPAGKGKNDKLLAALSRIGGDEKLSSELRLNALTAVPGGLKDVPPSLLTFLRQQLDHDQPLATRALAAEVLARSRLQDKQLLSLVGALKTVGPMEIDRLLEAFAQSSNAEVGRRLVAALHDAPALSALRVETLQKRLSKFGPTLKKEGNELAGKLNTDQGKQKARLEELLRGLGQGDVRRGQVVFNSTKAACSGCHAIGYLGGKVGPDLTRVGQIRVERDLLESIVFPSASFVQGYEPVTVTTKRGRVLNGLLRKGAPDEVVLALSATEEVRLARDEVEEMQPSKVSVMPAGLDQQLTPQELADLLAFLKACR